MKGIRNPKQLFGRMFSHIDKERTPYHKRLDFFSLEQRSLLRALKEAVEDYYIICPKVALNQFLFIDSNNHRTQTDCEEKIKDAMVDFLLCNPASMKPEIVVMMKDGQHEESCETFLTNVLESAGIKLVWVPENKVYSFDELRQYLFEKPDAPWELPLVFKSHEKI